MTDSCMTDIRFMALDQLGQQYRRDRLPDPEAEAAMVESLRRYGQQTPLVVCFREETHEVLDGFKRLAAARVLDLKTLTTRSLQVDERLAKAAILGLNQVGRRAQDWEEAWIVHALVREDGLTQEEVAELLSRHKSWVCRRLALVEKLAEAAREDLRLGLLSVTAARSLVRLPAGNQVPVLATLHRDKLTAAEARWRSGLDPGCPRPDPAAVHPGPATPSLAAGAAGNRLGLGPPSQRIGQPRGPTSELYLGGPPPDGDLAQEPRPRWFDPLRSSDPHAGILPVGPRRFQCGRFVPRPDCGVEHP